MEKNTMEKGIAKVMTTYRMPKYICFGGSHCLTITTYVRRKLGKNVEYDDQLLNFYCSNIPIYFYVRRDI